MPDNRHARPFDTRVKRGETYQDLKREIKRLRKCPEVKIIPIVIGALGTVPKGLIEGLEALEISCALDRLQKLVR